MKNRISTGQPPSLIPLGSSGSQPTNKGTSIPPGTKPSTPVGSEVQPPSTITTEVSAGLKQLINGATQVGEMGNQLATHLKSLNQRAEQLEGDLSDAHNKITGLEGELSSSRDKVAALEAELSDARERIARLSEHRDALATNLRVSRKKANETSEAQKQTESMLIEAQRLAETLKGQNQNLDEELTRTKQRAMREEAAKEIALSHLETFKRDVEKLEKRAEEMSKVIGTEVENLNSAIQLLNATMNDESPLGQLSPQLESIRIALAAAAVGAKSIQEPADNRRAKLNSSSGIVLSDYAGRALSKYAGKLSSATDRLLAIYKNRYPSDAEEIVYTFWESMVTFHEYSGIEGATEFAELVMGTLLDPNIHELMVAGLIEQTIRTAFFINNGRKLDGIEKEIEHSFRYDEWGLDVTNGLIRQKVRRVRVQRVDAMEGKTMIEIKSFQMSNRVAYYLSKLLQSTNGNGQDRIAYDTKNDVEWADRAVELVNQLRRYAMLIKQGAARKLELHLTSAEKVSEYIVAQIHALFPKNRIKVIWYKDLFSKGMVIEPSTGKLIEPTEPVEETPEPPAEESATKVVAKLQATIYQTDIPEMLEWNTALVTGFIEWLVAKGYWKDNWFELSDQKLRTSLEECFRKYRSQGEEANYTVRLRGDIDRIKDSEGSAGLQKVVIVPLGDWDKIKDERAQKTFVAMLRAATGKKQKISWSKENPTTEGIMNSDVRTTLTLYVEPRGDPRLATFTDLFTHLLLAQYGEQGMNNSYFKFGRRDGKHLTKLMKYRMWLDGRG